MRRVAFFSSWFVLLFLTSCSNSVLARVEGAFLENGSQVQLAENDSIQIDFMTADGTYPPLSLAVYARKDGSFVADMNDGSGLGLRPGKYKLKLNGEGTTIKKRIHPGLFKSSHEIEAVQGKGLRLGINLTTGEISNQS